MAYLGARFLKCDLQVQTPADAPRWGGAPLSCDEDGARSYVRACRNAGLEVIGVTDHNFASRDFIPILREAAATIAAEDGEPPLIIFPGFEIQADIGRGCHVLALFEPTCSMDEIDHTLTLCGIPGPNRFPGGVPRRSSKNLRDILATVQAWPEGPRGLVICPHAQSEAGIFDNERIAEWLQAEEFRNRDLLCLEVPKPPAEMSEGWRRLFGNGPDCDVAWRRDREIAAIMSSDAKALGKSDSPDGREHMGNFLGYRHTWLKMSEPSIEALRLAFLDPRGRIRFGDEHPHEALSHPWVSELRVAGADFVEDIDLSLSPGLNVVIGGRGTGKSSLLAALADATGARTFDGVGNLGRIASGGSLGVTARRGPQESGATWQNPAGSPRPAEMQRIRDLLAARSIGQGDLASLARDHPEFLRELVDEYVGAPLLAADETTRQAASAVREIADSAHRLPGLLNRQAELVAQRTRVESDLAATAKLAELSRTLTGLREDAKPVQASLSAMAELVVSVEELVGRAKNEAENAANAAANATTSGDPAHATVLEVARDALTSFASALEVSSAALAGSLAAMNAGDTVASLLKAVTDAEAALQEGGGAVSGSGDDLAEKSRALPQLVVALEKCVSDIEASEVALDALVGEEEPVSRLQAAWDKETALRRQACEDLNSRMPTAATGDPIVELALEVFGVSDELRSVAGAWARDGRRLSDRDFDSVLSWVHERAKSTRRSYFAVVTALASDLASKTPVSEFPSLSDAAKAALLELLVPANTLALTTVRGRDRVGATLRRQDGTLVGDLASGKLSFGQQVTVALAILLRVGTGPLVIDQPEEDLDGAFVFEELVPLIRSTREERQLLFATHNPNIPVGGDADLIIPLEVAVNATGAAAGCLMGGDGPGCAAGGLDRTTTKDAVEATLEGSRVAFRRRAEAYGY